MPTLLLKDLILNVSSPLTNLIWIVEPSWSGAEPAPTSISSALFEPWYLRPVLMLNDESDDSTPVARSMNSPLIRIEFSQGPATAPVTLDST